MDVQKSKATCYNETVESSPIELVVGRGKWWLSWLPVYCDVLFSLPYPRHTNKLLSLANFIMWLSLLIFMPKQPIYCWCKMYRGKTERHRSSLRELWRSQSKVRLSVFYCRMSRCGDRGGTVVKVLCYKSEGRWFDSRLSLESFIDIILPIALWPWGWFSL